VKNLNYGTLGGGTASQPYYAILGTASAINVQTNLGHTQYDAFQANLVRGFHNGFQYTLAYTFSKTTDWWAGGIPEPQSWALKKGVASGNAPNILNATLAYDLPFGAGKQFLAHRGFLSRIVGGRQISGRAGAAERSDSGRDRIHPAEHPAVDQRARIPPGDHRGLREFRLQSAVWAARHNPRFQPLPGLFRPRNDEAVVPDQGQNTTNTPHFANPAANVSNLQLNSSGAVANLNGFGFITRRYTPAGNTMSGNWN
jgi:hypothetical protein